MGVRFSLSAQTLHNHSKALECFADGESNAGAMSSHWARPRGGAQTEPSWRGENRSSFLTQNQTSMENSYKNKKYSLDQYDPNWPAQFMAYSDRIKNIFGDKVLLEHIGSTAVPDMSGKPCIDVLAIVEDLAIIDNDHAHKLEKEGFIDAGEFVMENARLFRDMKDNKLRANVHFFKIGHPHIAEMIGVRDYLRSHPEEVAAYSAVKKELYSKYAEDYPSYRKSKDKYMDEIMKKANQ